MGVGTARIGRFGFSVHSAVSVPPKPSFPNRSQLDALDMSKKVQTVRNANGSGSFKLVFVRISALGRLG